MFHLVKEKSDIINRITELNDAIPLIIEKLNQYTGKYDILYSHLLSIGHEIHNLTFELFNLNRKERLEINKNLDKKLKSDISTSFTN